METKLLNQIVLITGASSGIGEACAIVCARAGANLILVARRAQRLEQLATQLRSEFKIKTFILQLDIRDQDSIDNKFKDLPNEWANIDILINNAGVALTKDKLQDTLIDDLECMIDTNIKGLLYITKSILPIMLNRNKGHIVNIGSAAGNETYQGGATYCATKFAVRALSNGLRKDLFGTDIRVSLISPGMVETELSFIRFKGDQTKADEVYANTTPLIATDIAETVLFCLNRPPHVNISEMIVFPTDQASISMINRRSHDT